jgi:hypothetical protein
MRIPVKRLLTAGIIFSFLSSSAVNFAALYDPSSPAYEALDAAVFELDKEGIDVARNLDSPGARKFRASRPILGPLGTMELQKSPSISEASWAQEFKSGAIGAIVAVKENVGGSSASQGDFRQKWEKADKTKRIFISFTGADLEYAHKVSATLEKQGYVTFIFLEDPKQGPRQSPQEAGRFFREAGHHFVIDTPNARKSVGVKFERSLYGTIAPKGSGGDQSVTGQAGPSKPKGGPAAPKSTPPGGSGGGIGSSKPKAGAATYVKCKICGGRAIGYCHMRNINVCETHRYFTQGGTHWRCP